MWAIVRGKPQLSSWEKHNHATWKLNILLTAKNAGLIATQQTLQYIPGENPNMDFISLQNLCIPVKKKKSNQVDTKKKWTVLCAEIGIMPPTTARSLKLTLQFCVQEG